MQAMSYDIIIVGGGMVGSALALALTQKTSLRIAILEAQTPATSWSASEIHHRVSALALSSRQIFQGLKVWDQLTQKRVSPFTKIQVWDGVLPGEIDFDSAEIAEAILGYIVENNALQTVLTEKLQQYPQVDYIAPVQLQTFHETANGVELTAADGRQFKAKLAVAADGANSWLRQQANIEIDKVVYDQHALVATVQSEKAHQQIARQVFLATGPLAFLPLSVANTSSIVWSLPPTEAQRLLALNADAFQQELAHAFDYRLGAIVQVERRHVFPLYKQQAKNYVKSRVVLIGDAAHCMHPLAGQGVNIGLLDAASLAELIIAAEGKQRDFASSVVLRRYERWRRADNLLMLTGVDVIKHLFASEKKSIQSLRSFGLATANRMRWIKNVFIRQAVGDRTGLPRLARR